MEANHAGCPARSCLAKGTATVGILAPRAAHNFTSGYVLALPLAQAFSVLKVAGTTATASGAGARSSESSAR